MSRPRQMLLMVLGLSLVETPSVTAAVPDPALSTIPNVIGVPGGGLLYRCTIVGTGGPIDSANVTLAWSASGDTSTCWCPTQFHPAVFGITDNQGVATFNLALGGCLDPETIPGGVAIQVFVNSILIKYVGQVSPDVNSRHAPPCVTGLGDAISFTLPLGTNTYGFCYDLNSDLQVGVSDAVLLTPWVAGAATCDP